MSISKITIVGGLGAMGGFFRKRLSQASVTSYILDRPILHNEAAKYLSDCQAVLLTVPTQALEEVMRAIVPLLPEKVILMDISSVKIKPMQKMLQGFSGPVVGTHPLFGPDPDKNISLKIATVPGRKRKAFDQVVAFLEDIGLQPFETTAEEHDRAMAYIQGLNFVSTLSYLASTCQNHQIEKFLTPSFHRRLEAARKMLTEDAEMFQNLFEDNPYSHDAVRQYRSFLNLAAAGELDLLVEKASWWWWTSTNQGGRM